MIPTARAGRLVAAGTGLVSVDISQVYSTGCAKLLL